MGAFYGVRSATLCPKAFILGDVSGTNEESARGKKPCVIMMRDDTVVRAVIDEIFRAAKARKERNPEQYVHLSFPRRTCKVQSRKSVHMLANPLGRLPKKYKTKPRSCTSSTHSGWCTPSTRAWTLSTYPGIWRVDTSSSWCKISKYLRWWTRKKTFLSMK